MQNVRMGLAHCEEAWRTSGEHPRAGLFLFEAYAVFEKRALALALGQKLSRGDGPEGGVVRMLLGEVHPPIPSKPFSKPLNIDLDEQAEGDDPKRR
jgi:hypothetical protein